MISQTPVPVEYLTIIAPTVAEAMAQFAQRGLAAQGYAIAGQIGRHEIVRGDRVAETLAGDGMVAATFRRSIDTP
jgi:hypothetical protein